MQTSQQDCKIHGSKGNERELTEIDLGPIQRSACASSNWQSCQVIPEILEQE
jgi:hypothetical protein